MTNNQDSGRAAFLMLLPIAEFKRLKKAVNVLVKLGFNRDHAFELTITQFMLLPQIATTEVDSE